MPQRFVNPARVGDEHYTTLTTANRVAISILFAVLLLTSCVKQSDYEAVLQNNKILQEQVRSLQEEISVLQNEIAVLKETDQFYYRSGADAFTAGNYEAAIEWMDKLKLKFPQSPLYDSADKLVAESNATIKAAYDKEKSDLNTLLEAAKKAALAEAITMLSAYTSEVHPADLLQSAQKSLSTYQQKWEAEAAIRQVEQEFGITLSDYKTGWSFSGSLGERLYAPQIHLKFKNIKSEPLAGPIEITVNFVDNAKGEVFGDGFTYLLGYSDTPLQPGIAKTAYVTCGVGFTAYPTIWHTPAITAEIYLKKDGNRVFYRKIPIKRGEM